MVSLREVESTHFVLLSAVKARNVPVHVGTPRQSDSVEEGVFGGQSDQKHEALCFFCFALVHPQLSFLPLWAPSRHHFPRDGPGFRICKRSNLGTAKLLLRAFGELSWLGRSTLDETARVVRLVCDFNEAQSRADVFV